MSSAGQGRAAGQQGSRSRQQDTGEHTHGLRVFTLDSQCWDICAPSAETDMGMGMGVGMGMGMGLGMGLGLGKGEGKGHTRKNQANKSHSHLNCDH